jgi:hypothetical protein
VLDHSVIRLADVLELGGVAALVWMVAESLGPSSANARRERSAARTSCQACQCVLAAYTRPGHAPDDMSSSRHRASRPVLESALAT